MLVCVYMQIYGVKEQPNSRTFNKALLRSPHTHHDTEVIDNEEIKKPKDDFRVVRPICGLCRLTKPIKTKNYKKTKKKK